MPSLYDRLPSVDVLQTTPLVWVCGDLHLENFGSYEADHGSAYFDINDFDESALAPAGWDLVRFLASLWIVFGGPGFKSPHALQLCQTFLLSYSVALSQGKACSIGRETAHGLVRNLLEYGARHGPHGVCGRGNWRGYGLESLATALGLPHVQIYNLPPLGAPVRNPNTAMSVKCASKGSPILAWMLSGAPGAAWKWAA